MKKITFVGLGIMGSRMVKNLLEADAEITIFNRSKQPMQDLVSHGAKPSSSIADAVRDADVVFTMLSTPSVVQEVMINKGGGLIHMKPNSIWVDCTTVNPSFTLDASKASKGYGIRFIDAPVAGTKPHAENGELVFFIGGDNASVEEIGPYLDLMGKKSMHLGVTGRGSSFKMLVNLMLAQSMIAFSETVLLGERLSFDRDFLLNTLPNLVVSAPFTKAKAEMIRADNYDVQFPLEWMLKDLELGLETAAELDQEIHLAKVSASLFERATKAGMGRLDFAGIHQYLARQ